MKRIAAFLSVLSISVASFAQPHLVKDIWQGGTDSYMSELKFMNGFTYFTADDGVHGLELWRSDGTADGTTLVRDIQPGSPSSIPEFHVAINGVLYFSANDGVHGYELWKSNGTASGTQMIRDINPGAGNAESWGFAELNGLVYFKADDGVHGNELWRTDGTSAGTMLVKDIWPGFLGSSPLHLTKVNGYLYFSATHPDYDFELWKTDGTESGTQLVKDIWPGSPGASLPDGFTPFNDQLFFFANNGDTENGLELWKSDGTDAGTVMVKDINPDYANPYNYEAYVYNDYLYFNTSDGINGYELWKTDGSESNTVMVKDINPGSASSYPGYFTELNGELYFNANHDLYGFEFWKTDGTWGGTKLVKDINPGTGWSNPFEIIEMNGTLFFTADDGQHGYELWMCDGSTLGTKLVADILPGSMSPYPLGFTKADDKILFAASDDAHGRELWVYEPSAEITGFTLINALTDTDIGTINDGDIINLAALPTKKLNIRAETGRVSGSITFERNGRPVRTENSAPYAMAGDEPTGHYSIWTPAVGAYEVCATPHSGYGGTGRHGLTACVHFTVVNSSSSKMSESEEMEAELNSGELLQLYPNPSQGVFEISYSAETIVDLSVEVFDMFGKTVFSEELLSFSGIYQRPLDLSAYPQGVYLLRVDDGETTRVRKVVINER